LEIFYVSEINHRENGRNIKLTYKFQMKLSSKTTSKIVNNVIVKRKITLYCTW